MEVEKKTFHSLSLFSPYFLLPFVTDGGNENEKEKMLSGGGGGGEKRLLERRRRAKKDRTRKRGEKGAFGDAPPPRLPSPRATQRTSGQDPLEKTPSSSSSSLSWSQRVGEEGHCLIKSNLAFSPPLAEPAQRSSLQYFWLPSLLPHSFSAPTTYVRTRYH